ncbi:MAG TPA: helix-hairpin-helix domain-containing protein [Bacteroidales bacterium]|nr:helix-hairpin-helix domain-containing protein [Bacteroidales bacterium]
MKKAFRDFLSFSSGERKGVIILILLIGIITGINTVLVFRGPVSMPVNLAPLPDDIMAFEQSLVARSGEYPEEMPEGDMVLQEPAELFRFDPNTVSAGELKRLGLSSRQIKTFLNYRSKGGKFYEKEDIEKIYGLSPRLCARLMDYVVTGKGPIIAEKHVQEQAETETVTVEINEADTAAFMRLQGIGPVLATRIVKYRNLLGGFYDVTQLREVYGISDSLLTMISNRLYADPGEIRKLDLNKAEEGVMSRHPYIGRYTARGIIAYRSEADTLKSINELKVNGLITQETLEKLKYYVIF